MALPASAPSFASRSASLRPTIPAPPMMRTFMTSPQSVIPGLVPGIHQQAPEQTARWIPVTSTGMTTSPQRHAAGLGPPEALDGAAARLVLAADPALAAGGGAVAQRRLQVGVEDLLAAGRGGAPALSLRRVAGGSVDQRHRQPVAFQLGGVLAGRGLVGVVDLDGLEAGFGRRLEAIE